MSGPKVSSYELERQRREAEAKRLEEERKRREEEEKRRREEKRQQSLLSIGVLRESLLRQRTSLRETEKEAHYMAGYRQVEDDLERVNDDIRALNDILEPFSAATLEEALSYESKLKQMDQKTLEEVKYFESVRKAWDVELEGVLDKALSDIFASNEEEETEDVSEPSGGELSENEVNKEYERVMLIKKEEDKRIAEDSVRDLLSKANAYSDDKVFSDELKRQAKVMQNLVTLGDFHGAVSFYYQKEKELSRLENAYHENRAKRLKLYEDALLSYETACDMAGVAPLTSPADLSLEDTIKWLEEKRIETEASYLSLLEKKEIQIGLNEVMEELGYHVLAEKETVRKSGKKIHEEVFSFGEGTAVNITEAEGQITMEIVGLDTSTRMPDETEEDYLEEEMVTFCAAHKEIEEKLKVRGIVLKNRIQMNKPSREYARILNITAYDQKSNNISMIQERKRDRKSASAAASQSMTNN